MVIPRGRCSSGTVRVSTSNSWWITAVKGRYQQHDNRRLLASFPRSLGGDDSVAASRSGGSASWEPLPSIQGVADGNYQSPITNLRARLVPRRNPPATSLICYSHFWSASGLAFFSSPAREVLSP